MFDIPSGFSQHFADGGASQGMKSDDLFCLLQSTALSDTVLRDAARFARRYHRQRSWVFSSIAMCFPPSLHSAAWKWISEVQPSLTCKNKAKRLIRLQQVTWVTHRTKALWVA